MSKQEHNMNTATSPSQPDETFASLNLQNMRKKKNKMKRRFNDEQIRSLESMFEFESKLEPRQKLELAKDLGLQPRQVAIWFQNKRARWKTKQLEKEYNILQADYTNLAARFEAVEKEKHALSLQVKKLKDTIQNQHSGRTRCDDKNKATERICNDGEESSYNGDISTTIKCESEEGKPILKKAEYFGFDEEEQEQELIDIVEHQKQADGSLTSSDNWRSTFDTDCLFDESSSTSQWWDFWS